MPSERPKGGGLTKGKVSLTVSPPPSPPLAHVWTTSPRPQKRQVQVHLQDMELLGWLNAGSLVTQNAAAAGSSLDGRRQAGGGRGRGGRGRGRAVDGPLEVDGRDGRPAVDGPPEVVDGRDGPPPGNSR